MRNWRVVVIVVLCLALAGSVACMPFGGGGEEPEVKQQLVEVVRGDLVLSVSSDGSLAFVNERNLPFGISGTVAEVNVDEGDQVTEGQVLARLDSSALELAVRAAEADLELADNSFKQLTWPNPYLTFRFTIPESVHSIRVVQAEIESADKELLKELEGEEWNILEAREQLRLAQERLSEVEDKLGWGLGTGIIPTTPYLPGGESLPTVDYWTLRAAQIQVDKAQIALDSANSNLEKAVILAPFDGTIAAVGVKPGDELSTMDYATRTIVYLVDPTTMELELDVDEIDIPGIRLWQKAIISVDALPDLYLEGRVSNISTTPTEVSGLIMYSVTVSFDVPEGSALRVGMSATADIINQKQSDVLLVPDRAVAQDSQGNPIVRVMVGEQIEERPVVIGISDGYQTEIISGLAEGEVAVIELQAREQPSLFPH